MQRQRYWIELSFGVMIHLLSVRSLGSVMNSTANQFIVEEQRESPKGFELLSANDVRQLLLGFLPNKKTDKQELLKQVRKRHRQRLAESIKDLYAKNQLNS